MNPAQADISDILASLDRPSSPSSSSAAIDSYNSASLTDPSLTFLDHQKLTRFWISERSAPELLPWPAPLMTRIFQRLRHQITQIEDLASSWQQPNPPSNQNLNLTLSILQSDLSRTQYLIRSLLRCRLSKLTKHAPFYLSQSQQPSSSTPSLPLLSPEETTFLHQTQSLLTTFYQTSFLSSLPSQLQRLDDNTGGINMVEPPDLKATVFVRCLAERWLSVSSPSTSTLRARGGENWLDGSTRMGNGEEDLDNDDEDQEDSREFEMMRGQVWVVRWEDVKKGVLSGKLELL